MTASAAVDRRSAVSKVLVFLSFVSFGAFRLLAIVLEHMPKKPSILVFGASTPRPSVIALDLPSVDKAIELAKRLVEHTGKAITVRDAEGEPIETIQVPLRN